MGVRAKDGLLPRATVAPRRRGGATRTLSRPASLGLRMRSRGRASSNLACSASGWVHSLAWCTAVANAVSRKAPWAQVPALPLTTLVHSRDPAGNVWGQPIAVKVALFVSNACSLAMQRCNLALQRLQRRTERRDGLRGVADHF